MVKGVCNAAMIASTTIRDAPAGKAMHGLSLLAPSSLTRIRRRIVSCRRRLCSDPEGSLRVGTLHCNRGSRDLAFHA